MRGNLIGSGLITTYACSAACRHCMFASSHNCKKDYITKESALKTARILAENGTDSLHIGGGEPFLNFPALLDAVSALREYGISVDYIETNAFWCKDKDFVKERLSALKKLGVDCIMASVDPFHVEFVPLQRPLLLCNCLEESGFDYFVWQARFIQRLLPLDTSKPHSREELEIALGKGYVEDTVQEYGAGLNGRALAVAKNIYPAKKVKDILSCDGCKKLAGRSHCHADLYGNIIPSRCPGISVPIEDFFNGSAFEDSEKYPVLTRLYNGGTAALFEFATEKGFEAPTDCISECHLCYRMRNFLRKNGSYTELSPDTFYESMERDGI